MAGGYKFLLFICITLFLTINADEQLTHRQTIEIIIGGGGATAPSPPPETQECPPPPPPPCPPPPSPKPPSPKPPPPPPPSPKPPPPPPPPSPKPPSPKPPPPPPPSPKPSPKPPTPSPKPPSPSGGFESPRLALVFPVIQAFRRTITSDPLGIAKTWKGKNICRDYKGFLCGTVPDFNQRALAGVKFNNYNISAPDISDFLIGLKDLVFFHANSNFFTGTIPARVGDLRYFYELDLSNNKFNGQFPYQVLNAKKLLFLDLRFNTFAGVVPPQVFLLNLDLLFINNNKFVQKLPDNLGSTTALYLTLANNGFIGGIPKSIGQASNTLLEVLFLNNRLSGCLPYEIGLLKKSTVFDVGSNILTGPIPHSFQCLKQMELLNLAHNKFYGPVPEAVCSLPKLSNFTVSYNYFTQVGPQCRKLIQEGILDVKMNCILDLPNQRSPGECQKFFSTSHTCPDQKSLNYVPCAVGLESKELNSSDIEWNAPALVQAPAQAPRARSYGTLSPH